MCIQTMIKVVCNYCNKEIEKPLKDYNATMKKTGKFYCDKTCLNDWQKQVNDLTGKIFGKWKVLEKDIDKTEKNKIYWKCKCECGNVVSVTGSSLRRGTSKTCGKCSYNKFIFIEDYVIGYTTTGEEFYFDIDNYDEVSKHTWRKLGGRFVATINKKNMFLHSFIMKEYTNEVIDHKDNDPSNNKKSNLRFCSISENGMNQRKKKTNTSGITGVWWSKHSGKWIAELEYQNKKVLKETCNNFEEAVLKRVRNEFKYFKEYRSSKNDMHINEVLNKIGYSIERIISESKMEVINEK